RSCCAGLSASRSAPFTGYISAPPALTRSDGTTADLPPSIASTTPATFPDSSGRVPGRGRRRYRRCSRRHGRSSGATGEDVTARRPAHRGGWGAAGRWAGAAWDEAVLKAPRNWLRKASMGSSGAEGPGSSPSCQCQEAICLNTEGSRAMIETTTLWLAPGPVIGAAGCSSPSRMSTRFGSLTSVTHEVRTFIEYWIDVAKAWRSLLALPTMESRVSPRAGIGLNIEPLPILFQGTMVGRGAQGRCEETMSISAITGLWPGPSSSRWNLAKVYWSGIEA